MCWHHLTRYSPNADGAKTVIQTITVVHDRTGGHAKANDPRSRISRERRAGSAKASKLAAAEAEANGPGSNDDGATDAPKEKRSPFAHLKQMEHNFGVQQITKSGKQQRRILQLDFVEQSIFVIAKGQRARTIRFAALHDVDSDDEHPRFHLAVKRDVAHGGSDEKGSTASYEFEAESFEEKNEIFQLLMLIVDENDALARGEVTESTSEARDRTETIAARSAKKPLLKQGLLEKKGHSMAYETFFIFRFVFSPASPCHT
jgi:hypothetical protein